MKRGLLCGILGILMIVGMFSFVSAGPYGYDDSMDLKYYVVNGKITYGYGNNEIKYQTSLKPNELNWTEWEESKAVILRNEPVEKSWKEIFEEKETTESKETSGSNTFLENILDKTSDLFLSLFGNKEEINENVE